MRISDWSSDVCSSDLLSETVGAEVTEEALRARYDEAIADEGDREEAHASHILVDTEEQARSVIAELDKGAEFTTLAKQHSPDPGGAEGGDLGWFSAYTMLPVLHQEAVARTQGT